MNCEFKRKLPIPMEVKEKYPITAEMEKIRDDAEFELGNDQLAFYLRKK